MPGIGGIDTGNGAAGFGGAPSNGGPSFNINNVHSLRDNPIANALFGKGPQQQPGVGGPARDPSKLVRDPVTGMFYDPTTGTSYTDSGGQVVITNPNVADRKSTRLNSSH